MGSISVPTAILGAGALSAGAGVLGSMSAADTQAAAANQASQTQLQMFNSIQQLERPFVAEGYGAQNTLNYLLGLSPQASAVPTLSGGATPMGGSAPTGDQLSPDQIQQILTDRPDVAAEWQKAQANGSAAQRGVNDLNGYVNFWYNQIRPAANDAYKLPGAGAGALPDATASALSGAGLGAGSLLKGFDPSQLANDPSYKFRLQQGLDAITNKASAVGGVASGNTLKALTDYSQGEASGEYWNAYNADAARKGTIFNWLSQLSGSGQNAAANLGALGTNTAGAIANNQIGAGNAAAAGTVGATNAISNSATGLANNYLMYNLMQNQNPLGVASI